MRKSNLIVALLLVLILGVCLVACGEEEAVTFTVTFDTQGGSEIAPIIVETGKEITLPENPTKEGYIFDGWYIDKDLLDEFIATQTIAENITLYAKWACDHTPVTDAKVDADCENTGLTEGSHCSKCNDVLVEQQIVPAKGHSYGEWIDEISADCENVGTKGHYECSACHKHFDEEYAQIDDLTISANGHEYGEWISEEPATCTETGIKGHYECAGCHKYFDAEHNEMDDLTIAVDPNAHKYGEWINEIPSTCTETGAKGHYECATCHKHFDAEYNAIDDLTIAIDESAHDLMPHAAKVPTCAEVGWEAYYTCSRCDYSTYQEIPANGHNYGTWINEVPATCVSAGTKGHYECSACHNYFDAEHNEMDDLTIPVDPNAHKYATYNSSAPIWYSTPHEVDSIKFALCKDNLNKMLFIKRTLSSGGYPCTTDDPMMAIDVKIRHVENDLYEFVLFDGSMIGMYKDLNDNIKFEATYHHKGYWKWNDDLGTFTFDVDGIAYVVGAQLRSETVSAYAVSEISEEEEAFFIIKPVNYSHCAWAEDAIGCTQNGIKGHFMCENCGKYLDANNNEIIDLTIPAAGHDYYDWYDGVAPTCTTDGVKGNYTCKNCCKHFDANYNEITDLTIPVDQNAHKYSEWIDEVPSTCTKTGTKGYYICELCCGQSVKYFDAEFNEIEDITIPAGHKYDSDGVCENCGYFETGLEFTLNDDGESWSVVGIGTFSGTDLKIPSVNYDTKPVTAIGERAFYENRSIKSAFIPSSVLIIKDQAFFGCWGITNITLSDGLQSIRFSAFEQTAITSITIPKSVTDIGEWVFLSCNSLESIVVDEANTVYHSAGNCLINTESKKLVYGCKNSIIPDDGSVTRIAAYSFGGATGIESITIPDGVTSIGNQVFIGCSKIKTIPIPASMKEIGYIGDSCAFTRIEYRGTIVQWNTITFENSWDSSAGDYTIYCTDGMICVHKDEKSFAHYSYTHHCDENGVCEDCGYFETGLEFVLNSDGESWSVTGIGTFSGTDLRIPASNYDTKPVTGVRQNAFENASIVNVLFPSSITFLETDAFINCTDLDAVYITDLVKWCAVTCEYYNHPMLYAKKLYLNDELVTELVIPNGVTSIAAAAFAGCGLTSATIADSVTEIGWFAFAGNKFTNVEFGENSQLTYIGGYAFSGCNNLETVTIPDSVVTIENAFEYCTNLSTIYYNGDIAQWNAITFGYGWDLEVGDYTIYCTDGMICVFADENSLTHYSYTHHCDENGVCEDCGYFETGLEFALNADGESWSVTGIGTFSGTDLRIPAANYDAKPVTSIGIAALTFCTMSSVMIPDSITSIGDAAFQGCWDLQTITIGKGVMEVGQNVFFECKALSAILVDEGNPVYRSNGNCLIKTSDKVIVAGCRTSVIPEDGSVTSIGNYAFCGCNNLESIIIPNSVTSIGLLAFSSSGLKVVVIPNGVVNIGQSAFEWCIDLTCVTIGNGVTTIENGAFQGCTQLNKINYDGTILQWSGIVLDSNWDYSTSDYTIYCTDGTIAKDGAVTYYTKD